MYPPDHTVCLAIAVMNKDKLARLQAQVRTGGKGSVRRKKKAVHKTTTTGITRQPSSLSRLQGVFVGQVCNRP